MAAFGETGFERDTETVMRERRIGDTARDNTESTTVALLHKRDVVTTNGRQYRRMRAIDQNCGGGGLLSNLKVV